MFHAALVSARPFPNQQQVPQPVLNVHLKGPDGYAFRPGQYLQVHHEGTDVPLSIASGPNDLPSLRLHYKATPGDPLAGAMNAALTKPTVQISIADGTAIDHDPHQALLFIAGGTGAAQAFAIANHRRTLTDAGPITMLWCADSAQDLYDQETLIELGVDLTAVVDDRRTPQNEGLVWLQRNAPEQADAAILIGGSPNFVYAATDVLLAAGFAQDQLGSDVYSYAPR